MKIAPTGEWLNETARGHCFDGNLADAIIKFCLDNKLETILDIGCGDGKYVQAFNSQFELTALGIDGNPYTAGLGGPFCYTAKLHKPLVNDSRVKAYDLILSLEVGEHIPAQFESVFLDNVVKFAKQWIILSWAIPNQGGDGHVNCKDNNEIVLAMKDRGFDWDIKISRMLKDIVLLPWFKNSLMVFKRIKP